MLSASKRFPSATSPRPLASIPPQCCNIPRRLFYNINMPDWKAFLRLPSRRSAALRPSSPTPELAPSADTSGLSHAPEVPPPLTSQVNPQQSPPHHPIAETQNTANKISTTVINGLRLALGVLKEAVTGIGVPGLEAAVSGVVKVIEIIENVRDNDEDLDELSRRISGVADAVKKSGKLHSSEAVSEALRLRMARFLEELEFMLLKVNLILGDRNLASRTANSQAYKNAITDVNTKMDRLISQFSAEGIIYIELKVEGVDKKADDVKEAQTIQEYEALIEKMPRVHARYHDTSTKPSQPCHQGTRVDLLQGINNWIVNGDSAYLWLCGEVGVGKTTVAHTIAKQQQDLKQLGASYFFSRHDHDRQSPRLLFPSIAYQLARFDRGMWRALAKVLKPDPDIVNRGLKEQFTKLILEPLSRSGMPPLQTVVVVIDGLDECSDSASVLDALAIGIGAVGIRLRVLVCSRPYSAIQSKFKDTALYHLASQNHFHDINSETLSNDVATLLTWSLGEIASRPANSHLPVPWPANNQLDELIDRAGGLILIANTYAKYIDDPEEGDPVAQLNRILSRQRPDIGSPPLAELDALYDQVLDDLKRSLKTAAGLVFAREIIETVILAEGEISLNELATLFVMEPPQIRSVLRRLTAVILLPEDQEAAITPFHASFGEYIQDDARCTIRELSVDTSPAHGRIANRCINAIASASRHGVIGVQYELYSDSHGRPLHLAYPNMRLAAHIASSPRDQADEDRRIAMESCIWTWLNMVILYTGSLEVIRRNVETAGFKGLVGIEGADAETETEESIARLIVANHVLSINRTAKVLPEPAIPATESGEARPSSVLQLVKFDLREFQSGLDRIDEVLVILSHVRLWNTHNYSDMSINKATVDLDSLAEVQLHISSSASFRGICNLDEYVEGKKNLDVISRIRLALEVAKAVGDLHEASVLHPSRWPGPASVMISAEGKAVLGPPTWRVLQPSGDSGGSDYSFACQMIDDASVVKYWPAPEKVDRYSLQAQRIEDIWDFGSILFLIMTTNQPLRSEKWTTASRYPALEDITDIEDSRYWNGNLEDHVYHARYEQTVSLLLDALEDCEEVKAVLKACWALGPQDRPSAREVAQRLEAILRAGGDGMYSGRLSQDLRCKDVVFHTQDAS